MSEPLITVLIDTYNYGHFIEDAVNSVLSQDFPMDQVEILIVDDGSTDDTPERVKKFGSRVQYLHKPNGGQASAFNLGFGQAKGEFVALLDADDYFLPGKLRRVVEEFRKHPETGMLCHSLLKLDNESGELQEFNVVGPFSGFIPNHKSKLLSYDIPGTSGLVFRRKLVEQVLPLPEDIRLQADGFLGILMKLVAPVVGLSEALSVYRVHGQNLFHTTDQAVADERRKPKTEMFLTIVKEAKAWIEQHREQLSPLSTRLFLDRWMVLFQEIGFQIDPPNRFRFFFFLIRQNHARRSEQTWKRTTLNYLTAFPALVFGYERARPIEQWRCRMIETTGRLFRVFSCRR